MSPNATALPVSVSSEIGVRPAPESTGKKQGSAFEAQKFKPGQSGNPKGRPPGSRNAISQTLIDTFIETFDEAVAEGGPKAGLGAMRRLRDDDPGTYLKLGFSLIPKEFDVGDKTTATFEQVWRAISSGTLPRIVIEGDGDND
jgi:hypothetical protein